LIFFGGVYDMWEGVCGKGWYSIRDMFQKMTLLQPDLVCFTPQSWKNIAIFLTHSFLG